MEEYWYVILTTVLIIISIIDIWIKKKQLDVWAKMNRDQLVAYKKKKKVKQK